MKMVHPYDEAHGEILPLFQRHRMLLCPRCSICAAVHCLPPEGWTGGCMSMAGDSRSRSLCTYSCSTDATDRGTANAADDGAKTLAVPGASSSLVTFAVDAPCADSENWALSLLETDSQGRGLRHAWLAGCTCSRFRSGQQGCAQPHDRHHGSHAQDLRSRRRRAVQACRWRRLRFRHCQPFHAFTAQ